MRRLQKPSPRPRGPEPAERRIVAGQRDVIEVCGFEVDAEILAAVLDPENRLLWAFVHGPDGRVQPVGIGEDKCVWLEDSDLFRSPKDGPAWTGSTGKAARTKSRGPVSR